MIRIVELFSGIGSQAKAFSNLGVNYEVVNTCEWDYHSILAYWVIHKEGKVLPEYAQMSKSELMVEIGKYTLSCNGKTAASYNTMRNLSADCLRAILSAIRETHNFVSINDVEADDLPDDVDIMTYSFPCQDVSNVGAFHGYKDGIDREKTSRSGLLWRVEDILWNRKNAKLSMPRFLLMENVSALKTGHNNNNFSDWQESLHNMGYYSHVYPLNALDFGLPQRRERLFMLSVYTWNISELEQLIEQYFSTHDLQDASYRQTLGIPKYNLRDYLKTNYDDPVCKREAEECRPNDTPSRREIWEKNLKIIDEDGNIADHVATLTTKQDRDPNSGNLYMTPEVGKACFRYLTPRECMLLMGFDESDYDRLISNNLELRKGSLVFTRDRIIRMAGNSIAVPVLEAVFRQFLELHDMLYPDDKPSIRARNGADVHDPKTRSYNMSRIRSKHTKPEVMVSDYLLRHGISSFSSNDRELPGSPDFVIREYHTVIFVNGCFWHGHDCHYFHWPKNNADFWRRKITANRERDQRNVRELQDAGWKVITVWECSLKDEPDETLAKLMEDIRADAV